MQTAGETNVTGVDIYQYGLFKGENIELIRNPTSVTGQESRVKIRGFDKRTSQIPAALGKHFGIIYVVNGTPAGAIVAIRLTILTPPMKHPESKEIFTSVDSMRSVKIGAHEFHGWLFEHKWEVVPGQYTFQLYYFDKKLGEKAFTVG